MSTEINFRKPVLSDIYPKWGNVQPCIIPRAGRMIIEIKQIKQDAFPSYSVVSSEFAVESAFECIPADGGLGGILLRERRLQHAYHKYQDAEGPEQWSSQFDTSAWGFFLASDGGEHAGAAAVATPSNGMSVAQGRSNIAVLWDIRVQHTYRRQSVGSRLFQHCVAWARQQGFSTLGIETQNVNVPACRFYAKHGCELVDIRTTAYSCCPEAANEAMLVWHLRL